MEYIKVKSKDEAIKEVSKLFEIDFKNGLDIKVLNAATPSDRTIYYTSGEYRIDDLWKTEERYNIYKWDEEKGEQSHE